MKTIDLSLLDTVFGGADDAGTTPAVMPPQRDQEQQKLQQMLKSSWSGCVRVFDGWVPPGAGQLPGAYNTRVVCRGDNPG